MYSYITENASPYAPDSHTTALEEVKCWIGGRKYCKKILNPHSQTVVSRKIHSVLYQP